MSDTTTAKDPAVVAEEARLVREANQRLMQKRAEAKIELGPKRLSTSELCAGVEAKMREREAALRNAPASEAKPDVNLEKIRDLRTKAGIPQRHRYEIPDGDTPWHHARAKLVKMLGNGFIVGICGLQGTGKTMCASALIYAATIRSIECRYTTALDFFMAIKSTYSDGAKLSEAEVIATYVKPKLLVLDECDERGATDWENRLLFHMINQRYNNLVDTLLISREDKETFKASLKESIQSRIQETGGFMTFDWPSYRELERSR